MNCCVRFFKTVLGTDGHPVKVLQRTVTVDSVSDTAAIAEAQRRFEELEQIPDWKLHADSVEVEFAYRPPPGHA